MSQLAYHIGTCRCDHHNVSLFRNGHMLYLELEIPVKGIHKAFIPGKCLKSNGINKISGISGH